MKEEKIFLDLRKFDVERAAIRRLEKRLASSPEYTGKKGRVLFFKMDHYTKLHFFEMITKGLRNIGYKSIVCYESMGNLTN